MKFNSLVDPKKRELVREAIRKKDASFLMKKKPAPEPTMRQTQDEKERAQLRKRLSDRASHLKELFEKMMETCKKNGDILYADKLYDIYHNISFQIEKLKESFENPSQDVASLKNRLSSFEAQVKELLHKIPILNLL